MEPICIGAKTISDCDGGSNSCEGQPASLLPPCGETDGDRTDGQTDTGVPVSPSGSGHASSALGSASLLTPLFFFVWWEHLAPRWLPQGCGWWKCVLGDNKPERMARCYGPFILFIVRLVDIEVPHGCPWLPMEAHFCQLGIKQKQKHKITQIIKAMR